MKLGLVIKITNEGVPGETFSINKEDVWARYTEDVRTPIKELTNFDGTEKVAYLARFLGKEGYLMCVIKARPEGSGRANDNTAAWIHVPAFVDVTSLTICSILKDVEVAISGEKGIDKQQLDSLFSQEYKTKDVQFPAVATIGSRNDSTYAVRYYNGDFKLYELLGPSVAQKEYGNYKGIIFIDEQQGITHTSQDVLDFEPKKICQYAPPTPIDGFTPCFPMQGKYQSFNKAIEVPEGGQVTIHWVKNGYAVVKKPFVAKDGPTCPKAALINPSEYKVIIKREHFHIYAPNGVPVPNADISIDGVTMIGDSMEISETSYNEGVTLVIRVKGLADNKREKEKLSQNMHINMEYHLYHYDFEIPLRDGEEKLGHASFSIETHHKLKHCPIEGYETEDDNLYESKRDVNLLCKSSDWKMKIKFFLYGVVSVIIAAILIVAYNALENYEFRLGWPPIKEIKHDPQSTLPQESDATVSQDTLKTDLQRAIEYLESSETWHKDSLDNFNSTRGLFEAMNDFNLDALKQKKEAGLSESEKFSEIVSLLNKYIISGKNPHIGKENFGGKYNRPTDNGINVENYQKWLKDDHSSYVAPTDVSDKPKEQRSNITGRKIIAPAPANPQGNVQTENTGNKRGRL